MLEVPLQNSDRVAVIDDEDSPLLNFTWSINASGYAYRTADHVFMARTVIHAIEGYIVDHIDGDTLNNRRANLRQVLPRENARNLAAAQKDSFAGFIGVGWHGGRGKWQASIRADGKLHHLGLFADVEDAKRARAEAEIRIWGVQPRRKAVLEEVLGRTL